ncbi:MAG TPA: hypothetical protein VMV25_06105 [Steroidobacteraceae bacterium]|nr:hypothetical protein [Steroidobacteraceae bacterium]
MKNRLAVCALLCASLSGCVIGYGHCLFLNPLRISLSGKVHFLSFPVGGGIDRVAILELDRTAYVYAPAEGSHCLPVNETQLVGWSGYQPDLAENMQVTVRGSLITAVTSHQHTRFLIKVRGIEAPPAPPAPAHAPAPAAAPAAPKAASGNG